MNPNYDHHADLHRMRTTMDNHLHTKTWGAKDFAHLGGAAAIIDYLEKIKKGPVGHIKHELKDAINYIYYYEVTKNPFYKEKAWEEIKEIEEICEHITDPKEKEMAWELIHEVAEMLDKLAGELGAHPIPTVSNPRPHANPGY